MKINELLAQRPTLSFEIFPPKNKDGDITSIYSTIDQLAELKPDFISVTYAPAVLRPAIPWRSPQ